MSHPVWLIATREFRTYVATGSFWIALVLAPLLMGGALLLTGGPPKSAASASLTLVAEGSQTRAVFSENFPLSDDARRELVATIARDGALPGPVTLATPAKPKLDAASVSRLFLALMLWLTLVGSLGMLLQAVVRERANRALESLLTAARPLDIALGKLAGVGAVSGLVLAAWFAAAAGLAAVAPEGGGAVSALLRGMADPAALASAVVIYLLGFAFYGLATVALGAMARDNADAQNLARPMFAVLLVVFFTVLSVAQSGTGAIAWLAYAPPFTPFVLLVSPQSAGATILALGLLVASTLVCGVWAVRMIGVERVSLRLRRRVRA